ncbi:TenA family transcriptional regulator [Mycolicibacterium sp. BiH015]|uniref:TenA family transcriptional regulator n=1 Tax=Mycolicibacterium sp. BiH015 TaxID=3018808 RepID=UPI0022E5AE15|nr:TenA family transcriptional regulator [Mycolicibacterium sp. BiH015]MDA2894715.1 TenA family transcriptional regulator [Mycolicibacterium sp. BiH015]
MLDDLWAAATRHRFLLSVRDGTITPSDFHRWLAQDAVFVTDLLAFQARLLARAHRDAQSILAAGCVALVAELDWFDDQAAAAGIDMNQAPLPATLAYRDLLARLDTEDYPTAITALWVVEEVYLRAWTTAASDSSPYRGFVEHWTDPGFAEYVRALRELASPAAHEQVIAEVLSHEIAFWDMASTNT